MMLQATVELKDPIIKIINNIAFFKFS